MSSIFSLTASEIEVLETMFAGYSPLEIAKLRKRSVETIRQQIKSMQSKTNTAGMGELLHLARAVARSVGTFQSANPSRLKTQRLILADGRNLEYLEQGDPNGYPVIFLHGCLGGNRFTADDAELFARNSIRLIAPARPGHGSSDLNTEISNLPSKYTSDLRVLLEHLGVDRFSVLGFDIGCIYALTLNEDSFEGLEQIVCVSAQPPMGGLKDIATMPSQQRVFAILARYSVPLLRFLAKSGDRKLKSEGMDRFAKTVFSGSPADLVACENETLLRLFWEGHHFHVQSGSEGFINDCRIAASNWHSSAKTPRCNTTFVHGDKNTTIPVSRVEKFSADLNADLRLLKDAGHMAVFTHVGELISVLKERKA